MGLANDLEITSDNNIKSSIEWHVSANMLCTYMKKPEYLRKAIRNLALYPRYFEERLDYLDVPDQPTVTFPMLCFCDIPLSKVGEHMSFYGQYGIALKKNTIWGQTPFQNGGGKNNEPCTPNSKASSGGGMEQGLKAATKYGKTEVAKKMLERSKMNQKKIAKKRQNN